MSFIVTFGTLSFAVCDAFAWTITGKHDVIHKNRKYVTYRNAAGRETTPTYIRQAVTDNMLGKFGKATGPLGYVSGETDEQTDRQ